MTRRFPAALLGPTDADGPRGPGAASEEGLVSAAAPATSRRGYHCPDCVVTVEASWPGEAQMLAEAHDQVVHNRRVTALVGQVRVRPLNRSGGPS